MGSAESSDIHSVGGDGTRLVGRFWPAEGRMRRLLLIVHGLKDHGGRYDELARAVRVRGTASAAFDLRGHGRSEGEAGFVRRF
ncbi:MAG TPA: alpha/beta hydrolase, partial [Thermoplasmata archaeon]|nr:alpha/beta hydrolase [Thermoplasmata archaeon]